MNIDRIHSDHVGEVSHLEALYRTIPSCEELLAAVRAGHAEFRDMLAKAGLLDDYGLSNSTVHDYRDIEVHAFTVGIVSEGRWDEVQTKSFLTYASHWIDDFFDSPAKVIDPGRLLADRRDIRQALANMGRVGQVGFAMANRARHPAAVYKALHRMLYGGLVQRAADYAERHALVEEYPAVATQFVDPRLVAEIRHLQPEAYWTTNKSVLELLNAAEEDLDFNTSELWNLVYASALYYEDVEEERAQGELNFEEGEAPRLSEMLKMIRLGARYLAPIFEPGSSQMWQVEFVARAIPNLPDEVVREYRSLWSGHRPTVACA
ncbi:MAG: hypothetical protein ACHQZS_06095 [Candidatus Binatales bacterium]